MTCTCPACGKKTAIEADVGDFPSRCQRCGLLLRPPQGENAGSKAVSLRLRPMARSVRVEQGILAGLLISQTRSEEPETQEATMIIHASTYVPEAPQKPARLLRPESLREIARASARQKALRRATLRGNHQVLGFLSKMGFVAVAILCLGALFLEARLLLQTSSARAAEVKNVRSGK